MRDLWDAFLALSNRVLAAGALWYTCAVLGAAQCRHPADDHRRTPHRPAALRGCKCVLNRPRGRGLGALYMEEGSDKFVYNYLA